MNVKFCALNQGININERKILCIESGHLQRAASIAVHSVTISMIISAFLDNLIPDYIGLVMTRSVHVLLHDSS